MDNTNFTTKCSIDGENMQRIPKWRIKIEASSSEPSSANLPKCTVVTGNKTSFYSCISKNTYGYNVCLVKMYNRPGIFSGTMEGRMQQHTSFIHTEIGAALINHTSIRIDFNQTGRSHFTVHESKWMDQETLLVRRGANLSK